MDLAIDATGYVGKAVHLPTYLTINETPQLAVELRNECPASNCDSQSDLPRRAALDASPLLTETGRCCGGRTLRSTHSKLETNTEAEDDLMALQIEAFEGFIDVHFGAVVIDFADAIIGVTVLDLGERIAPDHGLNTCAQTEAVELCSEVDSACLTIDGTGRVEIGICHRVTALPVQEGAGRDARPGANAEIEVLRCLQRSGAINSSFVQGMVHDQQARAIVHAIVAMAKNMGMEVIAEGIETEEQKMILQLTGCRSGQGFLFSPAMDLSSLTLSSLSNTGSGAKDRRRRA